MTPPCYTFPAAELPERVQLDVHGRQRKMPPGLPARPTATGEQSVVVDGRLENNERPRHAGIDLMRDCMLLSSMMQYSCSVVHPEMRDSPVQCWPVQRMFRRCQDRLGSFMVETTAWEGTTGPGPTAGEKNPGESIGVASAPQSSHGATVPFKSTSASTSKGTISSLS